MMRQGPNPKRSRGRNGRKPMPNKVQTFDSNGPNGRLRGNAYQLNEKYLALARDAHSSGDRVMAENFFQHAEHYHRMVSGHGRSGDEEFVVGDGGRNGGRRGEVARGAGAGGPSGPGNPTRPDTQAGPDTPAGSDGAAQSAEPAVEAAGEPAAKDDSSQDGDQPPN